MITRLDIQDRVREWGLREDVVEKDYVLSWLLWGIGSDATLGDKWIFKGGTCLKKCYLETYRFSEDLDFTIMPDGPVREEEVRPILMDVLERVHEASGIEFSGTPPSLKTHPSGRYTEGRIYYRGPRMAPMVSKIILDLSASEKVARPTVLRGINHPFPDELPAPGQVRCYSFEEVFAEKIRAMGERSRPRDLYDIVNLYRRTDLRKEAALIREVLHEKCASKGVPVPSLSAIEQSPHREALVSEWSNMLAHQLQALPPFETYWEELADLFNWLEGDLGSADLPVVAVQAQGENVEEAWSPPPMVYVWGQGVPVETIRFAAANHLCLELGYNGTMRLVEPYALRRTQEGKILLVAVKSEGRETRTYRLDRIQSIKVSTIPFKPVFKIELGGGNPREIPQLSHFGTKAAFVPRMPSARRSFGRAATHGPVYVIKCGSCGKEFRRNSMNTALNPHKSKGKWPCHCRMGYFLRMG